MGGQETVTSGGVPVTDALVDRLSATAEAGYDVERLLAGRDVTHVPAGQFDALVGSFDVPDPAPTVARPAAARRRFVRVGAWSEAQQGLEHHADELQGEAHQHQHQERSGGRLSEADKRMTPEVRARIATQFRMDAPLV